MADADWLARFSPQKNIPGTFRVSTPRAKKQQADAFAKNIQKQAKTSKTSKSIFFFSR
jgi:hypothetical protein